MLDSPEVQYGLLVVGLFIVPRLLQRVRIPAAIVCISLGALAGIRYELFHGDSTIQLFSTLGIVSLFLFAGLEVDFDELRGGWRILGQHVLLQVALLAVGSLAVAKGLGLAPRVSVLYALALLTPSTGFILDSLPSFGLDATGQFWVKSKAVATELVALVILFVVVQSTSVQNLGISAIALTFMVAVLPSVFRSFSRFIAPYAPGTEFTFLILVALVCAFITRRLGVYYLVGAFVVGLTAVKLRRELPALTSDKLLGGVELFASFFIPVYFFKAGVSLERDDFTWTSMGLGLALLVLAPLKVLLVAGHRRIALGEPWRLGARVGIAVVPTLVFTLVIGDILSRNYALSPELHGALVVYTMLNTLLPGLVLHTPPPRFEAPTVPDDLAPLTRDEGRAAAGHAPTSLASARRQ